ncbi:trypsin-like peptidase domain-containing protein [Sporosarcina trichiuri]|uniref:trypsin-like peptidase domain-containing protein n=1 Tax=Sporosarcina trichiuri TaxID=3056445 RepID=UPI0025B584CE|nr:trypsin-like peptidase domain-containing protein [Sporosarcina sp. 0.2-SM1T-5]WJY26218.1 trypsin-like peptidase domain-containing protein [Sporosarcina sp. 0.2-SM1T-5]
MYCQHCGTRNEREAVYCSSCGKPLKARKTPGWVIPVVLSCLLILTGSAAGIGYYTDWDFGSLLNQGKQQTPALEQQAEAGSQSPLKPVSSGPAAPIKSVPPDKEKTEVIKESLPRVFTIFTRDGLGSGFLYKKGGLIVTNAHVVAGFTDVVVRNSDGKDAAGKVIGISDKYDVALIRSDAYSKLAPLVSETKETPIGTEVIALGSPQGFENSASVGYLTGLNRDMELGFVYEKIYQIDAQIDQGSSGGPLLDAKTGKVIGINSLLYKENNLFGFSIPMYSVLDLVNRWAAAPMSESAVASLFGVYDSYTASSNFDSDIAYDDEYTDFYDDSDSYYGDDYDEYSDTYEDESAAGVFADDGLYDFMSSFRMDYEEALVYKEGFSPISHYFLPGTASTAAFASFVDEVAADDRIYEFYESEITEIEIQDDRSFVTMYLSYSVADSRGEQNFFEKRKQYTIVTDEYGGYKISNAADF